MKYICKPLFVVCALLVLCSTAIAGGGGDLTTPTKERCEKIKVKVVCEYDQYRNITHEVPSVYSAEGPTCMSIHTAMLLCRSWAAHENGRNFHFSRNSLEYEIGGKKYRDEYKF